MQEVVFSLPSSFQIPNFYEKQTPERIALALRLGADAVENLFTGIAEQIREECNGELVQQLEKKHLKKQDQLERERRLLEETLDHLRAKISVDEGLKAEARKQIQEETRQSYKELLEEKERRIQHLQDQLMNEMRGLHEKFQTVKEGINRQLGSTDKGKAGETRMEDMIKKSFGMSPNFELQSVGKEAQKGDHIMKYKSIKVMWEIKNYTRMVTKEEVEKLHRDMRVNPEIRMAIMVALQTGIVGHAKAGDIDLEMLEGGRCIVYVNNLFQREDPIFYLQSLRPLLDLVEARGESKATQESEEVDTLKYKAEVVRHILLTHQKTLNALHNMVYQQKKKMDQMNSELMAQVKEAEAECANSLRELLDEKEKQKGGLDILNPELFTKSAKVDLNKNQKVFLEWLVENCTEDPDSEIETKKFLEALKPVLKTEKEIKEAREILQESVWPKGGKKIRGFRLN